MKLERDVSGKAGRRGPSACWGAKGRLHRAGCTREGRRMGQVCGKRAAADVAEASGSGGVMARLVAVIAAACLALSLVPVAGLDLVGNGWAQARAEEVSTQPAPMATAAGEAAAGASDDNGEDADFIGTTDHEGLFVPTNIHGDATHVRGNTFVVGTTAVPGGVAQPVANLYYSVGRFRTVDPIPLQCAWKVEADFTMPPWPGKASGVKNIRLLNGFLLSSNADGSGYSLELGFVEQDYGTEESYFWANGMLSVAAQPTRRPVNYGRVTFPLWTKQTLAVKYDPRGKTYTVTIPGEESIEVKGAEEYTGDAPYLFLTGGINWGYGGIPDAYGGMEVAATFKSMQLTHLKPRVDNITLWRFNEETGAYDRPVGEKDMLEPDELVLVRCEVLNTDPRASADGFDEVHAMHVRIADTDDYPTDGIAPFVDGSHPITVDGTALSTSLGAEPLTGEEGTAVSLTGNNPSRIEYFARVSQAGGQAVVVSHELVEDNFHGSWFKSEQLIAEVQLAAGGEDNEGLTAGSDYHYTRLPLPNENGWNGIESSPVAVTFYPGDFDRFVIAGASDGAPLGTLTAGAATWVRAQDTDDLPVSYRATHSVTQATSTVTADRLRIDTLAPRLSYDAQADELVADDAAPAGSGKAVSGIWKIRRVQADGSPLESVVGASDPLRAADGAREGSTFALDDGAGRPARAVASPAPGYYVAEDAAGNRSAVVQVKAADSDDPGTDNPGEGDGKPDSGDKPGTGDKPGDSGNPGNEGGSGSGDVPNPDGSSALPTVVPKPNPSDSEPSGSASEGRPSEPLVPDDVTVDPETHLVSGTVRDDVTVRTDSSALTSEGAAVFLAERYSIASSLSDGKTTVSVPRLFDAEGQEVSSIDRSVPGDWRIEATVADSAGNTLLLVVGYHVRESRAEGSMEPVGGGSTNGSSNGPQVPDGGSEGGANRFGLLPKTGADGGCPLHIVFLLMAVLAASYSLMRLRQGGGRRTDRPLAAAAGAGLPLEEDGERPRSLLRAVDCVFYLMVAAGAAALAGFGLCPLDGVLATAVVLLSGAFALLLRSRKRLRAARS